MTIHPDPSGYPPEPWDLRGQLHASVFLVPVADLPLDPPPGWTPVRLGRRAVVAAAWVTYEPGGVLHYEELMATVLVRRGLRFTPTIVRIWVDSETSRDGGRALWGIPKELADFEIRGADRSAHDEKGPIATAIVRPGTTTRRPLPVRFRVVQTLGGRAKISAVRSRALVSLTRVHLAAEPTGPLGFLAGRRPLMSLSLRDFRMSFGG